MSEISLVSRLEEDHGLSRGEYIELMALGGQHLFERARVSRERVFGKDVYMRGLIEFTSYCKNDCNYCGIRGGNKNAERYRLSYDEILECCEAGYNLGFRTFVLQGGEDPYYTDGFIADLVSSIKRLYPSCAVTLSIGEHSRETYEQWFEAGADRYLLRHETANEDHYKSLHPKSMSFKRRVQCLYDLKDIGYQVGCGFMVGSPGQTFDCLADDLEFIKALEPHMVGIGPFIPHSETQYKGFPAGDLMLTLRLLAIIRLMMPELLITSTTALGTINPRGRELGVLAGANVVMPNLSPASVRKKYLLYDNKICTGDEAAECRECMGRRMSEIGYEIVESRGDYPCMTKNL